MPTPAGEARLAVRTGLAGWEAASAFGYMVALGICAASYYVLRGLFSFTLDPIKGLIGHIPFAGKWVAAKIEDAEQKLTNWLGSAVASLELRTAGAFHGFADTASSIGWEIQQQALDYWHVVQWVGVVSKSVVTGEALQEIFHNTIRSQSETTNQAFHRLTRQDKAIRGEGPGSAAAKAKVQAKPIEARTTWVATHALPTLREQTRAREDANARASSAAGSIAAEAEHGLGAAWDRIRDLSWKTAGVGAVATVTVALSRLGLGWFRCSNVTRVGKRLCGMNPSAIDDLLAGTLAVFGTLSIVEFAKEMQAVVDAEASAMRALIRETKA